MSHVNEAVVTAADGGAPRAALEERLVAIERDHEVRILLAVESGSRAWGFPSRDSDFDVRFLYAHRREHYLSIDIERRRDVIETPLEGEWDVNGWDLRKALGLLGRSNPVLSEWLDSPIVYREIAPATARLRALLPRCFNPRAAHYHYLKMAQGNFREFLRGPRVKQKKYFYVLRPLLACRWIERELGVVPTPFEQLVKATLDDRPAADGALVAAIAALVADKRDGVELGEGPRIEPISAFIEAELERLSGRAPPPARQDEDRQALNEAFRSILDEVWPAAG